MDLKRLERQARLDSFEKVAIDSQLEGTMKLFEAASTMGNSNLMDQHRQELHVLLDRKCDITASTQALIRSMLDEK